MLIGICLYMYFTVFEVILGNYHLKIVFGALLGPFVPPTHTIAHFTVTVMHIWACIIVLMHYTQYVMQI